MPTSMVWETSSAGGFMYQDELSDTLRTALQPLAKFRQFCEPDEDALNKGLHRGEKFFWNVYGDVATQGQRLSELLPMPETNFSVTQQSLTVVELGNSVPYTGKLAALAKHDVLKIVHKGLKNDARKGFDIEAFFQFKATPLRATPTGGTSTTSVTVNTNGTAPATNNVAMGSGHIKAIGDFMRESNIPGFVDDDYIGLSHPSTWRSFKNELETIFQYVREGHEKIYSGEIGRYEGFRFVEQNFIPKGGSNASTVFNPYTKTADPWTNGKSSWAMFFGADTVNEALCIPEEVRAKLPGDYGRSGGIAWYYLGGFGIFHTTPAFARIVMWDSAT